MREDDKPVLLFKKRDRLRPIEPGPMWGLGQFRHQHLLHQDSRRKSRMVARWGGKRDYDIPMRRLPFILLAVAFNATLMAETLRMMAWMAERQYTDSSPVWRIGLFWSGLACVGFMMLIIHFVTRRHVSWIFQVIPIVSGLIISVLVAQRSGMGLINLTTLTWARAALGAGAVIGIGISIGRRLAGWRGYRIAMAGAGALLALACWPWLSDVWPAGDRASVRLVIALAAMCVSVAAHKWRE